jgi:hypothetical protein
MKLVLFGQIKFTAECTKKSEKLGDLCVLCS